MRPNRWPDPLIYLLLLVAATVATFLAIASVGQRLESAASVPSVERVTPASANVMLHVLLALAVVIVAARLFGMLFRHLHQPPVMGEILAGIVLGPSVLGRIAPDAAGFLLPASIAPFLSALSQLGVILFMFLVGLELDASALRQRSRSAIAVSQSSIVLPFLLGSALALGLYPTLAPAGVSFRVFALFLGVAMSVTAFPVLARILADRKMQTTPLGSMALACAAVDDVSAWCLLAFVVGVAKAQAGGALMTIGLAIAFIAAMVFGARPLIVYWVRRRDGQGLTRPVMTVACVALLLSALMTEAIGIHAVFGAFLLGALIPHDSASRASCASGSRR